MHWLTLTICPYLKISRFADESTFLSSAMVAMRTDLKGSWSLPCEGQIHTEKLRSQLKWFGSQARMPPRFDWDYNHLYFKLHCNTKLHSHRWIEGIFPLNKVKLRSSPFSVSVLPWCTRLSLSFDLGQVYTSIIRDFSYLFQYAGYNNQWWEKWRYFFQ